MAHPGRSRECDPKVDDLRTTSGKATTRKQRQSCLSLELMQKMAMAGRPHQWAISKTAPN
jgi:hypothetical protein